MLPRCLCRQFGPGRRRARKTSRRSTTPHVDRRKIEQPGPAESDFKTADHSPDELGWTPLIDPLSVIGGIGRSAKLIAATTLIGAAIGVVIALSTPKKYEAFAELLIDPRDLKLTDRDLTQTGLPNDATLAIVENQVRMLTSGTVLNRVVEQLNLTEDSEFNGQQQGGIGNIFSSLRALLSSGNGPGGDAGDRRHALAVGNLAESLHVERGGKTFVVSIGAMTEEPEKSALIAYYADRGVHQGLWRADVRSCRPRHRRIAGQAR